MLTVVDINNGKIRVGIEAPASVPIMRSELLTPEGHRERMKRAVGQLLEEQK